MGNRRKTSKRSFTQTIEHLGRSRHWSPNGDIAHLWKHGQNQLINDGKQQAHFSQLKQAQEALTWTYVILVCLSFETLTALTVFHHLSSKQSLRQVQLKGLAILGASTALPQLVGLVLGPSWANPLQGILLALYIGILGVRVFIWVPMAFW